MLQKYFGVCVCVRTFLACRALWPASPHPAPFGSRWPGNGQAAGPHIQVLGYRSPRPQCHHCPVSFPKITASSSQFQPVAGTATHEALPSKPGSSVGSFSGLCEQGTIVLGPLFCRQVSPLEFLQDFWDGAVKPPVPASAGGWIMDSWGQPGRVLTHLCWIMVAGLAHLPQVWLLLLGAPCWLGSPGTTACRCFTSVTPPPATVYLPSPTKTSVLPGILPGSPSLTLMLRFPISQEPPTLILIESPRSFLPH